VNANNLGKCEMTPACARDSIGTVRLRHDPPGDDRQTCHGHAGGRVVWLFGQRSPYRSTSR
jgi:hypothetical protein